jgi:cytochrome c peroxidase
MRRFGIPLFLLLGLIAGYFAWAYRPVSPEPWTDDDRATLRSLSIASLEPLPADPSNAVADDPVAAIMGNRLFFDTRLSADGNVSCATCHQPDLGFTDGLQKGRGIGESKRNTRSMVGVAYSPWLYWDGRRDSLWSQALSPLEDPREHGSNRMQIVRLVTTEAAYEEMYRSLFGEPPAFTDSARFPVAAAPVDDPLLASAWAAMSDADRQAVNTVFANIGKTIAAFERTVLPPATRFDAYVSAVVDDDRKRQGALFSKDEILGLQLFIGEARCTECHNGPLFTNHEFHNTGVLTVPGELPDRGRIDGVREVLGNEFSCPGDYSDDAERRCDELTYVRTGPELLGAMRTPSLRNTSRTGPYMHKGQLATLADVLQHYDRAPDAMIGHNEAKPLKLTGPQLERLEAFLHTLATPSAR